MDNNQPVTVTDQTTPPVEPTQVPIIPPAKKSNRKLLIILGVVVVFMLISVVLYLAIGKKTTSVVVPSPTPISPTITVGPTISINPTSNPIIELTLPKNTVVPIPNSSLTIIYKGQSAPNPKCVDCSTTTEVIVMQQKLEQKLNYFCGGIAGTCTEKQSAYGYSVTLSNVSEESATVKIQKQ